MTQLPIPIILIVLVILSLFSAFFSASETAVIGLSKIRLRNLLKKGVRYANSLQRLVKKSDRFIAAILIGNDFVNIAISAIVTAIFIHLFGYRLGVVLSTFIATFFVLIICEITPKILATKHTEKIALNTAPSMELFIKIFSPIIKIFTGVSNFLIKVFGGTPAKRSPLITEEELRLMIEVGKEEGVLTDEERKLLYRIFEFGDTKVSEVMIPKQDIVAVGIHDEAAKLFRILAEEGHGRIPAYKDTIENIVGIIYVRDLLYLLLNRKLIILSDIVHPAYFVSAKMRVNELLRAFQQKRIQIAIVTDEKNRTIGLVTLEDLIEEIVGEIEEAE